MRDEFRIGDFVRVLYSDSLTKSQEKAIGRTFEITDKIRGYYKLTTHEDINGFFRAKEIELAKVVSNKLSRKLYPNWEEKDGYLYAV